MFDEQWFKAFCNGDDDAWQLLLRSELGRKITYRCKETAIDLKSRKYLRQVTWEDILQECLVQIYRASIKHRREKASVPDPGFFWRVAERAWIGVCRRAKGSEKGIYQAPDTQGDSGEKKPVVAKHDIDTDSLKAMSDVELDDLIMRAGLTPNEKFVMALWLKGNTLAEIARTLGEPPGTVRSRFLSALIKLRKAMGE